MPQVTAAPVEPEYDPAGLDQIIQWVRSYIAMDRKLKAALDEARAQRDEAGRSERGRLLAVLTTKIEDALAWWEYLERLEPSAVEGEGTTIHASMLSPRSP